MPQWQDDRVEMTLGNQASNSCPGERREHRHEQSFGASLQPGHPCPLLVKTDSPAPAPLPGKPSSQHLPLSHYNQHTHLPHLPRSGPAARASRALPHLKRRNSELMFTFPVEREDRGEAWGLGQCATLPTALTFREDVHPVPMVELLQNEVHSLLVDTVSCQEKACAIGPRSLRAPSFPWERSSSSRTSSSSTAPSAWTSSDNCLWGLSPGCTVPLTSSVQNVL